MPFSPEVRTTVLVWCDRHCCLCKKACGVNIEVDHLEQEASGGSNEIDNAIPLCFDCHSEVHRYNNEHPRGTKYKIDELKARREQVYEEFTRHLVPPIHVEMVQHIDSGTARTLPDVGCNITHLGSSLPVQVRVRIRVDQEGRLLQLVDHHMSGNRLIHMNPGFTIFDHFTLPDGAIREGRELALRVDVTVIDQFGREHDLLPVHFVHVPDSNTWYLRPF